MKTSQSLGYAAVDIALRAPRVAVIVDVSAQSWMYGARIALAQCTMTWGGSGFVLVPHRNGRVHHQVLAAVKEYDPDYVAISSRTIGQHEHVAPGGMHSVDDDGEPHTAEASAEIVVRLAEENFPDEAGLRASELVLAACSSHRMNLAGADQAPDWDEEIQHLDQDGPHGTGLTAVRDVPAFVVQPCRAVPPTWGGALGLLTAARAGSAEDPSWDVNDEPTGAAAAAAAAWLQLLRLNAPSEMTSLVHNPGGAALSLPVDDVPPAWHNAENGLTSVSMGSTRLTPAYVVVGGTPEDFALWLLLDRLYGHAVWLHPDWFDPKDTKSLKPFEMVAKRWQSFKRGVHVCTIDAPEQDIAAVRTNIVSLMTFPEGKPHVASDRVTSGPIGWPSTGMRTLSARDNFSTEVPMPVRRGSDGGMALVTKPPAISMFETGHTGTEQNMSWQVDLSFEGSTMPHGRGLDSKNLCADDQVPDLTWIRSSRVGITWHSSRSDLVDQGVARDQQVARPKVQELGLADWAEAMARQRGFATQYSASGLRARVLATLWGSRDSMIDDFASPWRTVFKRFGPPGAPGNKGTSQKFDEGHGASIAGHGAIMTFTGIRSHWPDDADPARVRSQVDRLVTSRVLRRGLALLCAECHKAAFVALEELGQSNRCTRCSAVTDLSLNAWKKPLDEPMWFYDLHPVARELVQDNGDAPLVAAQHIKASSRNFTDAAELELVSQGSPVSETDLLIHADRVLITGEVKTSNDLDSGMKGRIKAAEKRALWADVLRADEVVLATTQPAWAQASINAMVTALKNYNWCPGHAPRLRLVTALGEAGQSASYQAW